METQGQSEFDCTTVRAHGTQPPLELVDVRLDVGGLTIITGASFRCARGTITALVGSNGSGKTTLLNAIAGFLRPTGGKIFYYGNPPAKQTPRCIALIGSGVARSFQIPFVIEELTVLDNILLGRRDPQETLGGVIAGLVRYSASRSTWRIEAEAMLEMLQLREKSNVLAARLSVGERRRVCLSRAIFSNAQILLLDEPLANLDQTSKTVVTCWFRQLVDEGRVIIVVEHELEHLSTITDQTVHLRHGKTVTVRAGLLT